MNTKIMKLILLGVLVAFSYQEETKDNKAVETTDEEDEKVDPKYFDNFRYVENLDSLSINAFIKKQQYAIIEFYLPSCQKCAEFAPHYNACAESVMTNSRDTSIIAFGKVNGAEQEELAKQFEVRRYPAIFIFKSRDPEKYIRYYGEQSRIPLERTIRRMIDSISFEMKTQDHIDDLREFNEAMVFYVGKTDTPEYRRYVEEAQKEEFDGLYFAHCSFPSCATILKAEVGDVVILKDFDEKHNVLKKGFTDKEFKHFIEQEYFPDIHEFNEITYFMTFDRQKPSLYFFRDSKAKEAEAYHNALKTIAPEVKTKVKLVELDIQNPIEKIIGEHFGVKAEDMPVAIIFEAGKVRILQYRNNKDFTAEGLKTFIQGFLDKTIDPLLKSEKPKENPVDEHGIRYVVADEFESFVNDKTKDVVMMFYTDECVHCQDHYPKYHDLAKLLSAGNSNIVFGKFNYSLNETKKIYTDRYPGIFIWPSENKQEIQFSDEIKTEKLINFVVGNASNPLHIHEDL